MRWKCSPRGHDGSITTDGGVKVSMYQGGRGWRKPDRCDEVLISYQGTYRGVASAFSGGPLLIQLGQNLLPQGLELVLMTSFTRFSRGRVSLSPKYWFGCEGFAQQVPKDAEVEYDVQLLDWNDVWYSQDGHVIFRGLGQPANSSATAGDSDRINLKVDAE